jgi:DNA polymerase-3 subunit alpha
VGEGLVGLIIEERAKNGPFADFYEFCERVDTNVLNKRTIESLIKAGGFDSMGHPRRGLLEVFEQIVDQTCARRRERDMGVMTLFGEATDEGGSAFDERPKIRDVEFDKRQRLAFEKEMLGLYVSDHPLMGAEAALRRRTDCTINDLRDAGEEGAMRTVGGVVTALQRKYTKKGDLMAVFMLEDLQSAIEVMVFPKTMQEHGYKLAEDRIVCVKGRLDAREDLPKIIAMDIEPFEPVTDGAPPVRISLPPAGLSERVITDLKRVLKDHPGESQVFLHLGERKVLRLPDDFCVDAGNGLVGELREMLGAAAVLA